MAARLNALLLIALTVCCESAFADLRVKSKYTTSGHSTETTVYTKDSRQRLEPGSGIAMLNQCDLQRSIQLFEQSKSYMVFPAGDAPGAGVPASSSGGVVTYTMDITDTGERKTMFGFTARHVKSVTTKEAGPNTCNPGRETVEFDGWYIDYEAEAPMCLANAGKIQAPPTQPGCNDKVEVKQVGDGKLGYPVSYTMKTTKEDGSSSVMEMQVVQFSTDSLDAALFDIPAGYSELKSPAEFSAALSAPSNTNAAAAPVPPAPKSPGAVRIGVAELTNRSSASVASGRDQLVADLHALQMDAFPLQGSAASETEDVAKSYDADYILYAEVAEVKKSSGGLGKFGGMLSKAAAVTSGGAAANAKEKVEAKVTYKLMASGRSKPVVSAAASGSNGGGLTLGSAIHLAASVTPMAMMMKSGLFNANMMQALGSANNFGAGTAASLPGMPRGGMAPGMGSFGSLLQATQSVMASSAAPTEESKAIADALQETAKDVVEAIQKKK